MIAYILRRQGQFRGIHYTLESAKHFAAVLEGAAVLWEERLFYGDDAPVWQNQNPVTPVSIRAIELPENYAYILRSKVTITESVFPSLALAQLYLGDDLQWVYNPVVKAWETSISDKLGVFPAIIYKAYPVNALSPERIHDTN